jgi:radical SAM superfamily enzyme YgiQ (UPF0313 family)
MKILLMSMPDIAPLILHAEAIHMPNLGIASVGANIDDCHEVVIVDLIRKRRGLRRYIVRLLEKIRPDVVGLSAMAWQYDTCIRIARLIRQVMPEVKIVIGGYHATLMIEEIAASPEAGIIDFMVRGEGEDVFRRLVNALDGTDRMADIPSLSYKQNGGFVHNDRAGLLDLSTLKLPIRDHRRLTWGYHVLNSKIEVMETSRGCTRTCNFCSIRHMYGQHYRTFPIERILADLDDIYHKRKTRWVFLSDDNLVLDRKRVMALCDAIIDKGYKGLNLIVQADCISMSRHEEMVQKMSQAGIRSVFLGIENVSRKNLAMANKGDIVEASRQAVRFCHRYGMTVVGGLVLGFPDDDSDDLIDNLKFISNLDVDAVYCQILTPYPKTGIRQILMDAGLVVNADDFRWYNGMWANVKTRYLEADRLQYLVWYYKQTILGWWEPSERIQARGKLWTAIWRWTFKPVARYFFDRKLRKIGWEGCYREDIQYLRGINRFEDLDG